MPDYCDGTSIRVPGKIVLAGEYAVLDGCPALSLAINRGVECNIEKGSGITTPTGDTRFVLPALKTLAQQRKFSFSDWNPITGLGKHKPGFGGSAAACVASCIAAGIPKEKAFKIHYEVQGSGSGIDVATSTHGGLIRYENGAAKQLPVVHPTIIWSGASAKTGPRVQNYLSWKERSSFVRESQSLVEQFSSSPIETCRELYRLLCSMSKQAQVLYQTESINTIVQCAERYHGGCKPSGAGGGDCLIAFFPDEESKNNFERECIFPIISAQPCHGIEIINKKDDHHE